MVIYHNELGSTVHSKVIFNKIPYISSFHGTRLDVNLLLGKLYDFLISMIYKVNLFQGCFSMHSSGLSWCD